ncbi:MAG: hypothetical protein U0570_08600 [Phycisphaerales bacterium]
MASASSSPDPAPDRRAGRGRPAPGSARQPSAEKTSLDLRQLPSSSVSPRFLEAFSWKEARDMLVCSIAAGRSRAPGTEHMEWVAVCSETRPAALVDVGSHLNVMLEAVEVGKQDLLDFIDRVYTEMTTD